MKQIFFIFSILTFLALTNLAAAQWYLIPPQSDVSNLITNLLKLPEGSLEASNFLWYVLVPFIAIWAIVLGFLRTLRIFPMQRNIELIISFCMAFATLPTGVFMSFVNLLLGFSGVWATGAFFIMFIAGVALYARGWTGSLSAMKGTEAKIRSLEGRLKQLDEEIAKADAVKDKKTSTAKAAERKAIERQIDKLETMFNKEAARRRLQYE